MDLEVAGERRPEANGSWEVFRPANGAEALLNRSVAVAEQRPSCSQPPPRLPLPLPIPLHDIIPNGGAYPLDLEDRWLERKLQNLQALRAMGSFAFSGRRALYADSLRVKMEDKSVDTSDLEVADDPMGLHGIDLITAALLFCLGDSPGGRGISDSRFVDGYRIDLGTQTFSFPSAILATNTMVGDVASASACDHASPQLSNPSPFHTLRLDLVLQCVARYQTKQRSMFTFVCGQLFRRDEFSSHFKNVHCDIHAGLNGWMEHRCPWRTTAAPTPSAASARPRRATASSTTATCAPSGLLQARGMVVLLWEKRRYPSGPSSWQIKDKVWRFSTAFGTVNEWKFANITSMADHLKKCKFNTVERREEAVPLPCMCFTRELTKEGRSLRSVLKPVL
ncbi:hypothetical protein ANANG_G00115500 [Anguilla anguilla]|uniref:F-box domain-containing protein n=1 Tax=Anguilla anguilla TaxID=7936 RepID=A0A9D3MI76_ANGAN|nr:hypothetical protein ANANG_G00115500 [Anguilla anguilla]